MIEPETFNMLFDVSYLQWVFIYTLAYYFSKNILQLSLWPQLFPCVEFCSAFHHRILIVSLEYIINLIVLLF